MKRWLAYPEQWIDALDPYPWLQFAVIVIVFLVLAQIVEMVLCGAVRRLVARTSSQLDDRVIDYLHRPVFATIAIIGLTLATYRLGLDNEAEVVVMAILKTIVILLWIRFALAFARLVLETIGGNTKRFPIAQKSTMPILRNLAMAFVLFAGAYSIMVAWDINITGLVASAGIVGLALSFAAQDTLGHLFAGVAILADRPYKVGDYIVLDSGERGEVTAIGLRSTRLLTRDDVEVIVPNGVMGGAKIVNESGGPHEKYRVRVKVGVAYGSDIDEVIEILSRVAGEQKEICTTPDPRVRFRAFGDSSLDFELLAWIERPSQRGQLVHELNCAVYRAFKDAGVTIPFPQRDLHIKETSGNRPQSSDSSV